MARYIDADRFEQEQAYLRAHLTFPDGTGSLGYCAVLTSVQIKDAPTEDVAPVIHAHWKWKLADNGWADTTCSNCGHVWNMDVHVSLDYDYCPYCGSKMDEEIE